MIWCRHPVERVISWYYYIRQGWYALDFNKDKNTYELADRKIHAPKWYKMSFEDCFLQGMPECSYPLDRDFRGANSHTSQVSSIIL